MKVLWILENPQWLMFYNWPLWVARSVLPECSPHQTSSPDSDAHSNHGSSAACLLEVCGRTYTALPVCTVKGNRHQVLSTYYTTFSNQNTWKSWLFQLARKTRWRMFAAIAQPNSLNLRHLLCVGVFALTLHLVYSHKSLNSRLGLTQHKKDLHTVGLCRLHDLSKLLK